MMSIAFPAGGSLYYAQDLEKVSGGAGIPLEDECYCIGPDTGLPLWDGRRSARRKSGTMYAALCLFITVLN